MIPGSGVGRGVLGGVSGASLPFARSNNKLTRRKTFTRDLGTATVTKKTESCHMAMGSFSASMQRTTVSVKRAIKFMPKTRSGSVAGGRLQEVIDLVDDDDGVGPGRRYGGVFATFWF